MDDRLILLMFLCILAIFSFLIWIAFGERKGGRNTNEPEGYLELAEG